MRRQNLGISHYTNQNKKIDGMESDVVSCTGQSQATNTVTPQDHGNQCFGTDMVFCKWILNATVKGQTINTEAVKH